MGIGVDTDAGRTIAANVADLPINTTPHWLIVMFKSASNVANKNILTGFGAGSGDVAARLNSSGFLNVFFRDDGGTSISLTGSTNVADGNWQTYCHIRRSATDWEWYINFISQFTSATNLGTVTLTDFYIGGTVAGNQLEDGAFARFISGEGSIGVAELRAIADTLRTRRVVTARYPLDRNAASLPEMSGKGRSLTLTSTTQTGNPPAPALYGYQAARAQGIAHVHSKVNQIRLASKLQGLVR